METSLLTPQGSFLLLQLSAPQLLFQIPILAQVHAKILPVPPLFHCYNSQMHFMSLPIALHFITFCKLCYGNSSAMKKIAVSPFATVWFVPIQYREKWSCTPVLATKPDFTSAEAKTCSTALCRQSHSLLTLEKRCSTQQLLLLKEYKHSEDQQTIKLHTYTKPILKWNLFFAKMLHSFLNKAALSPTYRESHATSLLCVLKGKGSEYLLSSATLKSYLTSSLYSSCHRLPPAQGILWWTMPLQPLCKWHSNPKARPDFTLSGIQNFLHYLEQAATRIPADPTFPSDSLWEALSDLCLVLSLMHPAGIV